MPEHCADWEYSPQAGRNGDVMDMGSIAVLMYPVCSVHCAQGEMKAGFTWESHLSRISYLGHAANDFQDGKRWSRAAVKLGFGKTIFTKSIEMEKL